MPSDLVEYCKVKKLSQIVNETLFINPGRVCKGNNPGSYVNITIYQDNNIKVIY